MNWTYLRAAALLPLVVALALALAAGALMAIRLNRQGGDSRAALRRLLRTLGLVFLLGFLAAATWDGRYLLRAGLDAARGNPLGYRFIGILRIHGEGLLTRDPAKAVHWFEKAALKGDVEGQLFMARVLSSGQGVSKDPVQALRWAETAALQGNPEAMVLAGDFQAALDPGSSAAWYRQAQVAYQPGLRAGDAEACLAYGLLQTRGKGAAQDPVEGLAWMLVASRQGLPPRELLAVRLAESRMPAPARHQASLRAEAILRSLAGGVPPSRP